MKNNYTAMNYYNNYYSRLKQEPSAEEMTDRFLKKYESSAGLSTRKLYYKRMPVRYTDWINNGGPIPFDQEIDKEPMVEMYIPQHRFQDLVEREYKFDSAQDEVRYYKEIINDLAKEERMRSNNPALKKAWENYQLLLRLCDSK